MSSPPKPYTMPFTGLPEIAALDSLRQRPQWVAWAHRWKTERSAWVKMPICPRNGLPARSNDPRTWGTYEEAAARVRSNNLDGVGFMLADDDEITGIDLDKVRDPVSGEFEPWAADILSHNETYAELSPSGRGIRMFALGKIGAAVKSDPAHVEIYGRGRYLTVTGAYLPDVAIALGAAPKTIEALRARVASFKPAPVAPIATSRGSDAEPAVALVAASEGGTDFFRLIKTEALARLEAWVPVIFPGTKPEPGTGAYRITSKALGRDLQEDLSIAPSGIRDFGIELPLSAIDVVIDYGGAPDHMAAARWICERIGWDFDALWDRTRPEAPDLDMSGLERQLERKLKLATVDGSPPKAAEAVAAGDADPVDIWGKFNPPILPGGVLPAVIEEFARVQGEMMGVDPGGLAMAALAVCAAALPDSIKVQVKQHDPNWTESARLWVALIGDPSTKKSPILTQAARPLARLDAALYRDFAQACAEYDALPKEERALAQKPRQVRLRIEDTTIEAAQEVLKNSPEGVLCLQDEMSGWFGSMDKYAGSKGGAADRSFWLRSFNGGSYAVNRIGRGPGFIENLSISMLGGIQPDPMRKIASESVDDGLLQRLFPIVLGPASQGFDRPTPDATGRYDHLVQALNRLVAPRARVGHFGSEEPIALMFDSQAQAVRRDLERRHLELMQIELVNKKLAAHIGKFDGLFARLCLLWHSIENAGGTSVPPVITVDTASRVAEFLHRFLLRHSVAFYAGILGLSNDHDRIAAVAGYILAHGCEVMTNRDVQRGDRTMRGMERYEIQRIFEQLEAFGWLTQTPPRRPSDPPHWKVNPNVHRLFADRAKQEATRRSSVRALIAGVADEAA